MQGVNYRMNTLSNESNPILDAGNQDALIRNKSSRQKEVISEDFEQLLNSGETKESTQGIELSQSVSEHYSNYINFLVTGDSIVGINTKKLNNQALDLKQKIEQVLELDKASVVALEFELTQRLTRELIAAQSPQSSLNATYSAVQLDFDYQSTALEIVLFPGGAFKKFAIGNLEQVGAKEVYSNHDSYSYKTNASGLITPNSRVDSVIAAVETHQQGKGELPKISNAFETRIGKHNPHGSQVREQSTLQASQGQNSEWRELLRKLTLINQDENVTVYLRDYHLDEQQRRELIDEISTSLNNHAKQTNIIINGKKYE